MGALGQDTRDILKQPTAGYVRHAMHQSFADQGQQARNIDPGRLDQRVDQQPVGIERRGGVELPIEIRRQSPHQRESIRMHTRTAKAEQDIAGCHLVSAKLLPAFHRANAETGKVVIAIGIHARHLCRFPADQSASGLLAAIGNACNDAFGDAIFELPGGEVV